MQHTSTQILFVDDEVDLCMLIQISLKKIKIHCDIAHSITQAKEKLAEKNYQMCITDLNLPDGHGTELVQYVTQHFSNIPIAVLTAYGCMNTAIETLKAGAFDFISKPVDTQALYHLIQQTIKPKPDTENQHQTVQLIGQSEMIQSLRRTVNKVARTQAPVFISGESGTGKEVLARLIHQQSYRKSGPFIAINCGAIPSELMESELFGHTKGSFTGATAQKSGLIIAADGGTLFLDELAELSMPMQVKLLRVLQEKKVRPIGSEQEISVNFRVISATHQNLSQRIEKGLFRQDLYFRLHVMDLYLPPLRERGEDILQLAEYFIHQICQDWEEPTKTLSRQAKEWLSEQAYPGNIRELRNILEKAITLCDEPTIGIEHLPTPQHIKTPSSNRVIEPYNSHLSEQETLAELGLEAYLENIEKQVLIDTLNKTYWNKTQAAKKLHMSFRSLRYKLKKFGLDHSAD